jgi:hypothetical protein
MKGYLLLFVLTLSTLGCTSIQNPYQISKVESPPDIVIHYLKEYPNAPYGALPYEYEFYTIDFKSSSQTELMTYLEHLSICDPFKMTNAYIVNENETQLEAEVTVEYIDESGCFILNNKDVNNIRSQTFKLKKTESGWKIVTTGIKYVNSQERLNQNQE